MTTAKRLMYGVLLAFAGAFLWLAGHTQTSYDRGGISTIETWMGVVLLILAAIIALSGLATPGEGKEPRPAPAEKKPKH
ncbi:MAG: hypothetical protein WCF85_13385 [Rhodospirillaceae bacterium]